MDDTGSIDGITAEEVPQQQNFFLKTALQGTMVVVLVYGLVSGWLWISSEKTMETLQGKLASQTVPIERTGLKLFGPPKPPPATPTEEEATEPETQEQITAAASGETQGETLHSPPATEEEAAEPATAVPVPQVIAEPATPPPSGTLPKGLRLLDSGLAVAPADGLFENSEDGRQPVIGPNHLTPFQAYRRPFDRFAANKPIISIAVIELGLSDEATQAAVRTLPPEVSLAISPYATAPDFWTNESRSRGHEVWMMLPVETEDYPLYDPGPHTLLVNAPERQNQQKLSWVMGRAVGYVGLISSEKPTLIKSNDDIKPVLDNVYGRGLAFIDTSPQPADLPQTIAVGHHAPYGSVDIWIDSTPTKEAINAALAQLEEKAKAEGSAVGIIHPLPVSYQEIVSWAQSLADKGIALAPLSAGTGGL